MTEIINYKNTNYEICKFNSESKNRFNQRIIFIKKLIDSNNNIEWKNIVKFSKIWSNIKFKQCKYNSKLYNYIKKFDNSI